MTKEQKEEFLQYLENLKLIQADDFYREGLDMAISALKGGWIPIVIRPLTKEEETENDEIGYCVGAKYMYDCPMPEDGQEVLVTTRYGNVEKDTFYHDDGWYFESYCDDDDVLAWQPLPEPYKKGE